jgi:predicted Zn-dependent protease with MMP-like domain
VPLGRVYPASAGRPARIVVYRRPVETRASGARDVAALVADIVTEQVAGLLGVRPEELDPGFGE